MSKLIELNGVALRLEVIEKVRKCRVDDKPSIKFILNNGCNDFVFSFAEKTDRDISFTQIETTMKENG